MNTYDSIIPQFVSTDEWREPMMKPHLDGDKVIATNGHIMIIVPVKKLSKLYHPSAGYPKYKEVLPREDKLFPSPLRISVEKMRAVLSEVPKVPVKIDCSICEGNGYFIVKNDLDVLDSKSCEYCDGEGDVDSKELHYDWVHHKIKIGEGYFNPDYIEVILNVAEINDTKFLNLRNSDETKANQIEFDDILILIMPVRCRNYENKIEVENPHEVPYEV